MPRNELELEQEIVRKLELARIAAENVFDNLCDILKNQLFQDLHLIWESMTDALYNLLDSHKAQDFISIIHSLQIFKVSQYLKIFFKKNNNIFYF